MEIPAVLVCDSITPLTPVIGRNQPRIATLMLLIIANCVVCSTAVHQFPVSQFVDLNVDDHSLDTSDNKVLDIQQLTSAQLNAWSIVPHFAEFASKSVPFFCMRSHFSCKSQRRAHSQRPCYFLLVWVTRFTCFRALSKHGHCPFFSGLILCCTDCSARHKAT